MRLIGPHTETAATASPGPPIGAATQPNPGTDSSRSNATPCARTFASSATSCDAEPIEYFVLRVSRSRLGVVVVRKDRLADRGAVRRLAAADPGGDRRDHPVADLLQVHDVGTVQDGQVHDQTGRAVQVVQQWDRCAMQPVLVNRQRSELNESHPELVVAAVAAQPAQLHEALEHAVRGRPGQSRAANDLRKSQPTRPVEGVQDQRYPVDDRAGGFDVSLS